MDSTKPIACLSLDLDNKWSYMKTHTDPGWDTFPSYLDILIPRVLGFLDNADLKITFFIVGQDAALEKNHAAIQAIANAGHEIGCHSFNHEPWLHLYSEEQLEQDISLAEKNIEKVTGKKPVGFRGPGYSLSATVLKVLVRHGYLYDASSLPTYIGPLARAYYFMTTKLSPEEKERRKRLYGDFQDGFMPLRPYQWKVGKDGDSIVEIPVTTMPIFKIPFHPSYILYLSRFSTALALLYFRLSLMLCKITHTPPSILLHPLDFLGYDDMEELSFFPAMDLSSERKMKLVGEMIQILTTQFHIVPIQQHAKAVSQKANISSIQT